MKAKNFVFYDGPSMLDGSPILGIAILNSENAKTGDMVQTFIIRADVAPVEALRTGQDAAICGDCKHRPANGGSCYVNVGQSVQSVYSAWMRGAYPLIAPVDAAPMLAGRYVRLGAYGDPAAIPAEHWHALLALAAGHTGYSHQWRSPLAQGLRGLVMASADSASERDVAQSMGWRTFRVRLASEALAAREIVCPASDEGGKRRQCITCRACDGATRQGQASIAIIVHGAKAKRFEVAA